MTNEKAIAELVEACEALLKLDLRDNGEYMADAITDMAEAAIKNAKEIHYEG